MGTNTLGMAAKIGDPLKITHYPPVAGHIAATKTLLPAARYMMPVRPHATARRPKCHVQVTKVHNKRRFQPISRAALYKISMPEQKNHIFLRPYHYNMYICSDKQKFKVKTFKRLIL